MHIAILNQDFPPETGAGPARITELAREWIAAGHQVSVVTGFPNRKLPGQRDGVIPAPYAGRLWMHERRDGIEVYRSWLYASPKRAFAHTLVNYLTFAGTSLVSALVALPRPDVLIASGPPYFQQFSGALAALARDVPLVLEIRDLWPDYVAEMGIIRRPLLLDAMFSTERWLLARADATVVVTEAFKRRLVEKGVAPDSISVVPNGVDTARYHPSDEPNPLGELAGDGPLVGYLGTFGAGQGSSPRSRPRGSSTRAGRPFGSAWSATGRIAPCSRRTCATDRSRVSRSTSRSRATPRAPCTTPAMSSSSPTRRSRSSGTRSRRRSSR
jgi:colanic acid biosynthesis glycosyl transferase WcaI